MNTVCHAGRQLQEPRRSLAHPCVDAGAGTVIVSLCTWPSACAACPVDATPTKLRLPKTTPVTIQSVASEIMAMLIRGCMMCLQGSGGQTSAVPLRSLARPRHHDLVPHACV